MDIKAQQDAGLLRAAHQATWLHVTPGPHRQQHLPQPPASTHGAAPGQAGGSARGARRVAPAVIADRVAQAHHAHGLGRAHALPGLRARRAVAHRRASRPPRHSLHRPDMPTRKRGPGLLGGAARARGAQASTPARPPTARAGSGRGRPSRARSCGANGEACRAGGYHPRRRAHPRRDHGVPGAGTLVARVVQADAVALRDVHRLVAQLRHVHARRVVARLRGRRQGPPLHDEGPE